tara:strand:- start:3176 stop:3319 length:144 start_codon:yes stop_codon:yes gene_type:complete
MVLIKSPKNNLSFFINSDFGIKNKKLLIFFTQVMQMDSFTLLQEALT